MLFHGRLSDSLETHKTSVDQVGLLMGGLFDTPDEPESLEESDAS